MLDHANTFTHPMETAIIWPSIWFIVVFMTLEGFGAGGQILLSYDASGSSRAAAAEVCRIIFGRTRTLPGGRVRTESGFIHRPGVVWVGQSVLLLPTPDAEALAARVRRLGVRVAMGPVSVSRETAERFRRPS